MKTNWERIYRCFIWYCVRFYIIPRKMGSAEYALKQWNVKQVTNGVSYRQSRYNDILLREITLRELLFLYSSYIFMLTFVLDSKYTFCQLVLCLIAYLDMNPNVSHEWRFEKERNFIYWKVIDYWTRNNVASICIFSSNFMKMHFVPYFIWWVSL